MDIPRIFTVSESEHRIHNPFTQEKYATLGRVLRMKPGTRILDLGSGSGEMLCTWARDHTITGTGTGIDMSPLFTAQATRRAEELGVSERVHFIHNDAAGYVANEKCDVAACVGATWIAGGVAGTMDLLAKSLKPGGIMLIGEPYWRQVPATEETAQACGVSSIADFLTLPGLVASFDQQGYDLVEMVLADQEGWDRYEAAKWMTMRRWLEENPDDDFAQEVRAELTICAIPLYFKLTVAVTDKQRAVTRLKRRIDDKERIFHDAAPVDSLTRPHVVRGSWFLYKRLIK